MKFKIPILNGINFAIIFIVLYSIIILAIRSTVVQYLGESSLNDLPRSVIGFNFWYILLVLAVTFVIGFLIGILIEFIFKFKERGLSPFRHKLPEKVSTKLILVPSLLLLLLLIVTFFYIAGFTPYPGTAKVFPNPEVNSEVPPPEPEENVTEEVTYDGYCEESELKREYNADAQDYEHVEVWDRNGDRCNVKQDCLDLLDAGGASYNPDEVRCTI